MSSATTRVIVSVGTAFAAGLLLAVLGLVLFSSGRTARATTGTTDPVTGQIKQMAIDVDQTGNAPGIGTTTLAITKVTTVNGGTFTTSPGASASGFVAGDTVVISGSNTTPSCDGTHTLATVTSSFTVTGGCSGITAGCNQTGACTGTATVKHLLSIVDTVVANVPLNSVQEVDVIIDEAALADGNFTGYGFDLLYDKTIVSIIGHNAATGASTDPPLIPGGFEPGVVLDPDTSGDWRFDYVDNGCRYPLR